MKLLYFGFLLLIKFSSCTAATCSTFTVCPNFQQNTVTQEDANIFNDESEIANQGHWEGIKPIHYDLNLNFQNLTNYEGNVAIEFAVVQATNKIVLNHDKANPHVNYSMVTISNCNLKHSPRQTGPAKQGCIQKATFLEKTGGQGAQDSTLTLELSITLNHNENYVITFESFKGRDRYLSPDETGAYRLRGAQGLVNDREQQIAAITTIFQMRYARTVFPCFDHPSLKATFNLCLGYPDSIMVASNTLVKTITNPSPNMKRDCFETTPKMPTYVFTFSVMENYVSQSINVPNGPKIEVLAPANRIANLTWMLEEAAPVVQYMERITNFKFPLKRLAFIAQYPAPFWGVENFGLVTVDGFHMQKKAPLSYVILYHEIVHQWLGNVATISHWSEICLQEGLTAYFEWKISADRRGGSLLNQVREEKSKNEGPYQPYAKKIFKETQDIANNCFGRPPLFFHTANKLCGGFEAIENFLKKLIEKAPFETANLDMYDQVMGEVCKVSRDGSGNNRTPLGPGFIKSWFLQPGPIFLKAWQPAARSTCVSIRQQLHGSNVTTLIRPVPLPILFLNQDGTSYSHNNYMKTEDQLEICGHTIAQGSFIIDPDGETFTRKAYTSSNYLRVMKHQKRYPQSVTGDQVKNFVDDFCLALVADKLPFEEEPSSAASDWLEVFQLMKNSTKVTDSDCMCCLKSKEEVLNPDHNSRLYCYPYNWNQRCAKLRIMVIVGRNYTINERGG